MLFQFKNFIWMYFKMLFYSSDGEAEFSAAITQEAFLIIINVENGAV